MHKESPLQNKRVRKVVPFDSPIKNYGWLYFFTKCS